jgi:L-threonylcarbamoyladenylate synthase
LIIVNTFEKKIMSEAEEVQKATNALKAGKIILYPTDTIWGLGCDPGNPEAVKKLFELKGREENKAMIILIERIEQLRDYVVNIPEVAWDIVDYSEKPLTVIYPKGKNVAENLLPTDGSIAIRLVREDFCKALIRKFKKAIVSTSANLSGNPSPASFKDIDQKVIDSVDHVVNLRQNEITSAQPSVVMKIELNGEIKFLRK